MNLQRALYKAKGDRESKLKASDAIHGWLAATFGLSLTVRQAMAAHQLGALTLNADLIEELREEYRDFEESLKRGIIKPSRVLCYISYTALSAPQRPRSS